jgi:transposase
MPLRFLVFHLVVAMASKKRVVLDLHTKIKVVEVCEKDKLSVKDIVTKFSVGKTQVYDLLKAKSETRNRGQNCSNGSIKRKL